MGGLLLLAMPVAFVGLMQIIAWTISFCGWRSLARHYRSDVPFVGEWFCWQSIALGWLNYSGGITFGVNAVGLYFRPVWLFRGGHGPLFVPWEDVQFQGRHGLFGSKAYTFTFAKSPGVTVTVQRKLGERLACAAADAMAASDPRPTEADA